MSYRKNKGRLKQRAKLRYRQVRKNPQFLRKKKIYRKNPQRHRRLGHFDTGHQADEQVPITEAVEFLMKCGGKLKSGYVTGVVADTWQIEYRLEDGETGALGVERFFDCVVLFDEEDIDLIFAILDRASETSDDGDEDVTVYEFADPEPEPVGEMAANVTSLYLAFNKGEGVLPSARKIAKEFLAARRRRKPKRPKRGPPPKMVVELAKQLIRATNPYKYIEEIAADEGQVDLETLTLGGILPALARDARVERTVKNLITNAVEATTNRLANAPVSLNRAEVEMDLDEGVISLRAKFDGASIHDPDQDIEVPASQDLAEHDLYQALKTLGAKTSWVEWRLDESRYGDISDITYKVRATWEFDPVVLAKQTLNQAQVQAAVAKGVAKHEPW